MPDARWPKIKKILDDSIKRWEEEHGRKPAMKAAHVGTIGWETKEQLVDSKPYDLQLVEPEKVGNGRAHETNLLKILARNIGAYRRMPSRGPYLSHEEIEEIARWIDEGMPD